jgi:hypothetical protein
MATPYSITITMSQDTVEALNNGGYNLYGFKAVGTSQKGGQPLVWFTSNAFGLSVAIDWSEQYEIYTSKTQIVPGVTITGTNAYPANLGQCLNVTNSSGTGTIVNGDPMTLEANNETNTQLTCGIGQYVNGDVSILCAFPLYGGGLDAMRPIEKIALMLSTKPVNTGSVIEQAFAPGVTLDLTNSANATITFDINKGWSGSNVPTTDITAKDSLTELLIEPDNKLAALAAAKQ